jgi:hypothetical protein
MGYKSKVKQQRRTTGISSKIKLRPDLGMALAAMNYLLPLTIGCSSPMCMGDIEWDVSISGVLSSCARIGDNPLPSLPLICDGYFFTIALNNDDELSKAEVIVRLQSHSLIVRIEPKYKYLTSNGWEWVLPLVPVNITS